MADNFHFDVTGAPLGQSLAIATSQYSKVYGWSVDNDGRRLVLYWTDSAEATPLPAPLQGGALEAFVRSWLQAVDYGTEPDIDGSVSRGWRIYNEAWAQVASRWQAFVAIEPAWLLHGK